MEITRPNTSYFKQTLKISRMKKLLTAALLCVITSSAFSQQIDTRRKIEVIGSAETEVTPDIIYLAISLREYFKDNNNKNKVEIEILEKQLQTAVLKAGIPKENFTVNNISAYASSLSKKQKPEFLASKQYKIKVTDLTKLNAILGEVDPKGIQYTNVESYDYSRIETVKKELKVKALQAAREKANYLALALNDNLGDALEVQEINNEHYPQPIYRANAMYKSDAMAESSEMPDIDFKKIKLNYQMRTVFELK